jgi:hypothetical protein
LELQRALFQQLTGSVLAVKGGTTAETQLADLQLACVGKRLFVVLDDVWDKTHERQLNCIDPVSTSKILVTTRIRGLVPGCDELALGLLEPEAAVDLLLRTGCVEKTAASTAAAEKVVALCDYLPLYIGICGGIIHEFEGDAVWQDELVLMLEDDRLGVMKDGAADDCIVSTSLSMLKDNVAQSIFLGLGLCPEDVSVPVVAVQLIYEVVAGKAATVVVVRKSLAKLLDRNLLQGSIASGVNPHDLVRDYMRRKLGGDGAIREKQRPLVRAMIISQAGDGGWTGVLGEYVHLSLRQHMEEALLADPVSDSEAQEWVDSSNDVLNDFVVRHASDVIGASALQKWAVQHEAAGDLFTAAKRRLCASTTAEIRGNMGGFGNQAAAATGLVDEAMALLTRCDMPCARTLEALVMGSQLGALGFSHPSNLARIPRLFELIASGVSVSKPVELLSLGLTVWVASILEPHGCLGPAAGNHMNLASQESAYDSAKMGYELIDRAIAELGDDHPAKVVAIVWAEAARTPLDWAGAKSRPEEMAFLHRLVTHERLQFAIDNYDFDTHHQLVLEYGLNCGAFVMADLGYRALAIHGDVPLARAFLSKVAAIYETHYDWIAARPTEPLVGLVRCSDSLYRRAGLVKENLACIKAARSGFVECDAILDAFDASKIFDLTAFVEGEWSYDHYGYEGGVGRTMAKRHHWLTAPDEVSEADLRACLPPPEAGSAGWFDGSGAMRYDHLANNIGCGDGAVAAEVYEALGEFENGLVAAETDLRCMPHHPFIQIEAGVARARCLAQLGRLAEAEVAFDKAAAEAVAFRMPFWEMLVRSDLVVYVLDGAGRRDEQMAPLGRCIAAMVRPAAEYTELLGAGLDAEAAVAAFQAGSAACEPADARSS